MCIPILSKDKIQKLTVRKIQTFKLLSREKGYQACAKGEGTVLCFEVKVAVFQIFNSFKN